MLAHKAPNADPDKSQDTEQSKVKEREQDYL